MPRHPDIGWQHGKMIGGHRHHVQCNYCQRTMIGGITRFKKHLASKRGEIKGCEAVPKEVREIIRKHLATFKPKKTMEKRKNRATMGVLVMPPSDNKNTVSDGSDQDITNARQKLMTCHEGEVQSVQQQLLVGTREFFDAFSSVPCKDDQGMAPPRATDLGWAHGMMVNGDRQKIKCRYCHKVILGGGISRLKQHLAGERGNIAPCEKVPDDVKMQMQQHLGFKVLEKLKKQRESEVLKCSFQQSSEGIYCDIPKATCIQGSGGTQRGMQVGEGSSSKRKRIKKSIAPQASPIPQPTLQLTFASQDDIDQADTAVAKFMYDAGITFNSANSFYFQQMADAIAAVGPGYKMPSYHHLRGKLLNKCVHEARELSQELRKSWEVTGCTVMVDRWKDKTGCAIINFLVYCPKGAMFLKSVDASDIENTSEALLSLFDSIVQEVGPRNIVQFMTDSALSYKSAGRMLMNKYKSFFCSICATHCIELMLEDLGKLDEVKETLAKAKRITQFIYNHAWVLNLMRKKTKGRDIIQLALTESLTNFLTLQSITSLKDSLHHMFTCIVWEQSAFSKQRMGVEVTKIVLDPLFWSTCTKILKITEPLISVLHLADSDGRPSMGYLYDAMEKAKKSIIVAFNNEESEYLPYLKIVDHIREELHSPLHGASYYLNPSIFYNPSFSTTNVIQKGLLDCIETLEPNLTAQDMITRDIAFYEDAVGDFSRPVALRGRESLSPATWWSLYASDYPDLQRFAIRILSQTCSITRYERNWRMSEHILLKRKNRLEHGRLNDLIFVHYNLRFQQRQPAMLGGKALTRGVYDPICFGGRNIDAGDWVEDPGIPLGEDHNWMNLVLPSDAVLVRDNIYNMYDSTASANEEGTNESNGCDYSEDS